MCKYLQYMQYACNYSSKMGRKPEYFKGTCCSALMFGNSGNSLHKEPKNVHNNVKRNSVVNN